MGGPHTERERCHLHKGVESVRLAPVEKYRAVGKETETEEKPTKLPSESESSELYNTPSNYCWNISVIGGEKVVALPT